MSERKGKRPIDRASVDKAYDIYSAMNAAIGMLESVGLFAEDGSGVGSRIYEAQTAAVDIIMNILGLDKNDDRQAEEAYIVLVDSLKAYQGEILRGMPDETLTALEKIGSEKSPDKPTEKPALSPWQAECLGMIDYVLDSLLEKSTIITSIDLTDKIREGIFLLTSAYGLGFRMRARADWEWIEICESDDSPALAAADIRSRELNAEKFVEACEELAERRKNAEKNTEDKAGKAPAKDKKAEPKNEFGWLSPSGNFVPSPFGSHDESAEKIIEENGWEEEFLTWSDENRDSAGIERDFLISAKRYVLLHNPNGPAFDAFVTSNDKTPLTKKQKEFLFDYYSKAGNSMRAALYGCP